MAPYHGALFKGTAEQTFEPFRAVGEVGIAPLHPDTRDALLRLLKPLDPLVLRRGN